MEGKLGMTCALTALMALAFISATRVQADTTLAEVKSLYGSDLQVLGQIQQIDLTQGVVVVAGQHITISRQTVFTAEKSAGVAVSGLEASKVGDVLAVSGELDEPAAEIVQTSLAYVAGATPVYVKGKLSAVEASIGVGKIGDLVVDFTPAMASAKFPNLEAGDIVEAVGIQPSANSKLLVTDIVRASSIDGTSGLKADSIDGTSSLKADSIDGTSGLKANSIDGTSGLKANSIDGTSGLKASSIDGTSGLKANSIDGTSIAKATSLNGT